MHILSLMHVPFEDAANLGRWAAERGHTVQAIALYDGQTLPSMTTFDAAFVMGGPMNIYEQEAHPWLQDETAFLKMCIEQDKRLIGVCLGAQLVADALGGKVTGNVHKEIGWHTVTRSAAAATSPVADVLPERFTAFHWHGDTFEIPPDAIPLAHSPACANQAFLYRKHVLGLQFHLEYTHQSIEAMLTHCADELTDGPYIQHPDQIRQGCRHLPEAKRLLWDLLDWFFNESRQFSSAQE